MARIDVKIHEKGDPEPVWSDVPEAMAGEIERFAVLQGEMESGKASVAFLVRLADGTPVLVQTSATMMDMMTGAMRGAQLRWGEL